MTDSERDIDISLEDYGETKNFLYDIVTYKEWEQESEVQRNWRHRQVRPGLHNF